MRINLKQLRAISSSRQEIVAFARSGKRFALDRAVPMKLKMIAAVAAIIAVWLYMLNPF